MFKSDSKLQLRLLQPIYPIWFDFILMTKREAHERKWI